MRRVLIVDGVAETRRALIDGTDWAALGCTVVAEAESGEAALAASAYHRPELILTDAQLPGMDGLSMLRALRERGDTVHVIVLAANGDFAGVREALRLGAADYLLRPLAPHELTDALERLRARERFLAAHTADASLPAAPQGERSRYVRRTLDYIAAHYADADISIPAIARALSISEGHLSHVFKRETGYTTLAYLTLYRVHTARRLLADGRYRVYEVAAMVGYRDVAYFSATFKRLTGVSPSTWQAQCR